LWLKARTLPAAEAGLALATLEAAISGVNLTNILLAAFAPKSFRQKITSPNCKQINSAQRTLVWKSCLQSIVEINSHAKVLCTAFKRLQFGFVIFWQKDFGAKAAHKILVKLTPGRQLKGLAFSSIIEGAT
jgi:hypothetical protein